MGPASPPASPPAFPSIPRRHMEVSGQPRELVGMIGAPIFLDSAITLTLVIGRVRGVVGQHVFLYIYFSCCNGSDLKLDYLRRSKLSSSRLTEF